MCTSKFFEGIACVCLHVFFVSFVLLRCVCAFWAYWILAVFSVSCLNRSSDLYRVFLCCVVVPKPMFGAAIGWLLLLVVNMVHSADIIASYTTPTWTGGPITPEFSVTTVTLDISSRDGSLGFNNTRVFESTIRAPNDKNQVKTFKLRATYSDPMRIYDVFHKGYVGRNTLKVVTWRKFNRLTPIEEESGVFNHTARSFTGSLNTTSLNDTFAPIPSDQVPFLVRRLLSSSTTVEGEVGEDFGMKEGSAEGDELYHAFVLANSANDASIDQSIGNLDAFTQERLVPMLNQSAQYGNLIVAALNASLLVSNQTVQTSAIVNQTMLFFNSTQTAVLQNFQNIIDLVNRSDNSVNSTGAPLVAQLQTLSNQVSAGAMGSVEQTALMLSMFQTLQADIDTFLISLTSQQSDLDNTRRGGKQGVQVLSELRLRPEMRRSGVKQYWALVDYLGPGGLTPFTSRLRPGQRPQGFVNEDAGVLLDRAAFLDVTFFWNTQVVNPSIDIDPDVSPPSALDSLTGNALSAWNSLRSSDEAVQFRYANQRRFSFFCDNDWLLKNRAVLLTIQDIMDFIGPIGCTPGANLTEVANGAVACRCWARVERARCSLLNGVFITNADEPIPPLREAPDVCQSGLDLDVWYDPRTGANDPPESDVSITQKKAVEIFTSTTVLNEEIRSVCGRFLGNVEEAPNADSKYFLAYTSYTGIDQQNPGVVFRVFADATRCGVNHVEMEIQTNQGPAPTFPYDLYGLCRVVTAQLFKTVYGDWELQFGGSVPQGQAVEIQPFFIVGLLDRVPPNITSTTPPPFAQYVEVVTTAFVGGEMVPVYDWVLRPDVFQDVQVDIIDPDTDEVVTQRFSGDRGIWRSTPEVPGVMPVQFTNAGWHDLWFLNGPTPPRADTGDGTLAQVFAPHIFDTDSYDFAGIGQPEGRRGAMDYHMDFTKGLGSFNPFTNPRTPDFFTMDDWLQQNNRSVFDPRFVGKSLHSKTAFLIPEDRNATYQDPVTGEFVQVRLPGIRCHPTSVARNRGMGVLCRIFETHTPLPNGPILPELDADIGVRRFTDKFWSAQFTFTLRGSDLTVQAPGRLDCPNPQQIRLVFPNGTAQVSVDNEHGYVINVTVDSVNANPSFNCTDQHITQFIQPFSTVQFSLSYCPLQRIDVSVTTPDQEVQACWSNQVDMPKAAAAINRTFYRGDLDVFGNTTDAQLIQQDIIQEITTQSDSSVIGISLVKDISIDSSIALLVMVRDLLQIQAANANASVAHNQTLQEQADRAKLLIFQNQNLQEAAQATLTFQFTTLLNLSNSLDPQRQLLNDNAQKLAALNTQYLQYVSVFRSLNGSGFELSPEQVDAIEQAQLIYAQLQAQTEVMITIGNRTFAPPLGPSGELVLEDLGTFDAPFYVTVHNLASDYNAIAGVVGHVAVVGAETALKLLGRLTPDPNCPLVPIKAACDLWNLIKKIFMYLIFGAIAVFVVVMVIIIIQSSVSGAVTGSIVKGAVKSGAEPRRRIKKGDEKGDWHILGQ